MQGITASSQKNELSDPPYMAHSSDFVMTLFNVEPGVVHSLLPEGVKAKINDAGMTTGGIEIYETDRIHGIANYGMAFIFVEVEDLESNNGTPGHWAIWGSVDQAAALENMQHYFNFPYKFGEIEVANEGNVYTATVGSGQLILKVKSDEKQPVGGEGIVNMCSLSKDGKILKTEVPWFSTGRAGELIDMEVNPQGNKILDIIKNCKPHFTIVSTDQTFSYSRPVPE